MAKTKAPAVTQDNVTEEVQPKGKKVTGYEEWRCEIKLEGEGDKKKKVVEKVKRLRENVKITDTEAETLNRGAKDSPRQDYVIMYFKPE
jgi:hypothetical protein